MALFSPYSIQATLAVNYA